KGLLTDEGHQRLVDTLPDVSMLEKSFGVARHYGQAPHDRFALEYDDSLDVADPWKEFVAELRGPRYRDFLRKVMGIKKFDINCHWHYATTGGAVSPHCDSRRKHGSHVLYFNTPDDWDPAWGGQTMVLDDHGRFNHGSNPDFEDLECVAASQTVGNYSLLFKRGEHSWHGVSELRCPPGHLRKIFIVVVNRVTPAIRVRRMFGALPQGY
ncbi:MAG: 2OG-Fe(II) oxygenase, partial [Kiloniellaceae bacterium]